MRHYMRAATEWMRETNLCEVEAIHRTHVGQGVEKLVLLTDGLADAELVVAKHDVRLAERLLNTDVGEEHEVAGPRAHTWPKACAARCGSRHSTSLAHRRRG